MQILIIVVAYESESCVKRLLGRIPEAVVGEKPHILVSDDASTDRTAEMAEEWARENPQRSVTVIKQPDNLGYGGNQRFCFDWAAQNGAEVSVLLHGDEQYPPEHIEAVVTPIMAGDADAVYGSRMMIKGGARAGGMPLVRFVGNRVLSQLFNVLAGTSFSEWFSGFRAYRTETLQSIEVASLPDGFDFDAAITCHLVEVGSRVIEVPIPTRYAEELSRVPLVHTGLEDLRHTVGLRLAQRSRRRGAEQHGPRPA